MANNEKSPPKNTYCVWADEVRRVFQEVEAGSPKQAYKIAKRRTEDWQRCEQHDSNAFRVSNEVQDLATEAFVTIDGHSHCKSCGSEIVETINDANFNEGECGPCEYQRYLTIPALVEAARNAIGYIQRNGFGHDQMERIQQLEAAVAKANGLAA